MHIYTSFMYIYICIYIYIYVYVYIYMVFTTEGLFEVAVAYSIHTYIYMDIYAICKLSCSIQHSYLYICEHICNMQTYSKKKRAKTFISK